MSHRRNGPNYLKHRKHHCNNLPPKKGENKEKYCHSHGTPVRQMNKTTTKGDRQRQKSTARTIKILRNKIGVSVVPLFGAASSRLPDTTHPIKERPIVTSMSLILVSLSLRYIPLIIRLKLQPTKSIKK